MTPQIFISYSHDSNEHKEWILELSNKLRNDGIKVALDQTDLHLGSNISDFMKKIEEVDRVLIICTKQYYNKIESKKGGSAYEDYLITTEIIDNIGTNKFIPIIRQDETKDDGTFYIPISLRGKLYINLSNDKEFDYNYKDLIKELHNQPLANKAPIGISPFDISEENFIKKNTENIAEIFDNNFNKVQKKGLTLITNSILKSKIDFNTSLKCGNEYSMFIFALKKAIDSNSQIEDSYQYSYQMTKTSYGYAFIIFFQKNINQMKAYSLQITLNQKCEIKYVTLEPQETTFKFKELDYSKIGTISGDNLDLTILKFNDNIKFEASNGVISKSYQSKEINKIINIFRNADNGMAVNEIINKDLNIETRIHSNNNWFIIFNFYNNENDYPDKASVWISKKDFKILIRYLEKT